MTDIPAPTFELYDVTSAEEFAEVFPLLQQLGRIETPEINREPDPRQIMGAISEII